MTVSNMLWYLLEWGREEEKKTDSEQKHSTLCSLNLLQWFGLKRRSLHTGLLVLYIYTNTCWLERGYNNFTHYDDRKKAVIRPTSEVTDSEQSP